MRAQTCTPKSLLALPVAVGLLIGASSVALAQTDSSHDAMKSHNSMSSGHMMSHGTKHDSMTKHDAMKHDSMMKHGAMESSH